MATQIILTVICVFAPLFILWLTYRFLFLRKIGNIILAYVLGCLIGLSGLLPDTEAVTATQTAIASAAIPLAIPLMLFSSDISAWASLAPSFTKSLIFGLLGCTAAVVIGFLAFGQENPELYANIGGMLSGLYTGGTANLASLKVALNVDDATYLQVHTYSIVVSALYLLFVVIFGKQVLRLVLPAFKDNKDDVSAGGRFKVETYDDQLFFGLFRRDNLPNLAQAIGLTLLIVAIGAGIALLTPENMFQAIFILAISLLSICASLLPAVRRMKRSFEAGTYFILIFSIAVSSQVRTTMFENIDLNFFFFTTVVTMGALFMHVVFSAIARIDTDTTLVTSIALICSPPFVPVMTGALHNRAVLGPGIAVGLIGYAIGTYLGFGLAKTLYFVFC